MTTSLARPWNWGIVVVTDNSATGELPDIEPGRVVSANETGLVILIRHAQDIDDDLNDDSDDDGDPDLAEGSVSAAFHHGPVDVHPERQLVYEGTLLTPSGTIHIGDAELSVAVPAGASETRVLVSVSAADDSSPDQIWLDLWSQDPAFTADMLAP
ncbi:hypothetical protein [Arthrobacter sp. 35W]|uniref:hypothetical protein n=1 Tax=Arthrobacter sp. 35W TaxID=1132441 RepID=UPI0012DE4A0C|nr:hypothetical protein [Arthrobacter sp. 35W]